MYIVLVSDSKYSKIFVVDESSLIFEIDLVTIYIWGVR